MKAKSPEAKSDALDVAAASGIISRIQADVEAGRLAEVPIFFHLANLILVFHDVCLSEVEKP